MKSIVQRACAGALAVALFSACTKASTESGAAGGGNTFTQPGTLRFSDNQDVQSLNPVIAASAAVGDLSMFIYSYAVRYNGKGQPVPDALTELPTVANGDVTPDGLTLKYKLRHDIKWQDGVQLTCADLRFTWQVVMNPKTNVATTDGFRDIKDVDCHDPYVAVVHMKKLYAPYLQQLWGVNSNAPILPEHLLAKYNDNKGSLNNAPFNSMPIGSGPFKVVEWERGNEVRMEANPNYFLGRPKLNEVIYKIMPDENTEETQLQTHEIDMIARGTGINWLRYQTLAANPANGIKAQLVDSLLFDHIDFNLQRPLFQDRNLRIAISYATNRQEIADKIYHGAFTPDDSDQPKTSWAYAPGATHYDFDPAKARATLDADGWHVGPDGIRVKGGKRLEFQISTQSESTNGKAIQTVLQSEWHDVGIQADVKNYPTGLFFENGSNGIDEGGKYDVATFAWTTSADPDDSPLYSGDNLAPTGQNALFWTNPAVTAAERDALSHLDQATRKKDYAIIQQQIALDVPTIIIGFRREVYAYNSDLKGFDPSPVISAFWNPWEYSI